MTAKYKQIGNDQQFMSYLIMHKIRLVDYTYTNKDNNAWGIRGRKPIENPYLWGVLINTEDPVFLDYLLDKRSELLDKEILTAILQAKHAEILTDEILTKLIDTYKDNCLKFKLDMNFDDIIFSYLSNDNVKDKERIVKFIFDYMKRNYIKPKFDEYGNIANGMGLREAAKTGDVKLVHLLLDNGADVTKDDYWSFVVAAKYGWYEIANILADHGANIHIRNDLAKKMIERNDKNGLAPFGDNIAARKILLDRYK